jgi:hypothetical protein
MDNQIFKINPDKHDDGGEEKKREKKVVKLVCVSLPPFDIKNPLKNSWERIGKTWKASAAAVHFQMGGLGKERTQSFPFKTWKKKRTENFVIHQEANDYHHLSFWYHRRGISYTCYRIEGGLLVVSRKQWGKRFFLFQAKRQRHNEKKLTNNRKYWKF